MRFFSAWTGLFCSLRSRKAEELIISPILDKILCRVGEGRGGGGGFGVGEGRALLRMSFRYPERIVVNHTSIQMSLFQEHTRRQVVATTHGDRSLREYRSGDLLQQHVAATHCSDKSLCVHWRIFVDIFASATEFCRPNKSRLVRSRPQEFLRKRSELFRPRSGQARDEVARASARAILNQTKDFFLQQVAQIRLDLIFYDMLLRQNSVAEKRFSQKFSRAHEAICRCDVSS